MYMCIANIIFVQIMSNDTYPATHYLNATTLSAITWTNDGILFIAP